jgi:hypothetical protein
MSFSLKFGRFRQKYGSTVSMDSEESSTKRIIKIIFSSKVSKTEVDSATDTGNVDFRFLHPCIMQTQKSERFIMLILNNSMVLSCFHKKLGIENQGKLLLL